MLETLYSCIPDKEIRGFLLGIEILISPMGRIKKNKLSLEIDVSVESSFLFHHSIYL